MSEPSRDSEQAGTGPQESTPRADAREERDREPSCRLVISSDREVLRAAVREFVEAYLAQRGTKARRRSG